MADIYAFPTGVNPHHAARDAAPDLPGRPVGVPDAVWDAVESVRAMRRLDDVRYREIPVPSTLADFGIGVELESGSRGGTTGFPYDGDPFPAVATGWIMLLYSNDIRPDWGSRWRCVAFARLPLSSVENDSLAPGMYWDDMCARLEGVEPDSVGGTVTVTQNTTFGSLGAGDSAGCEMRVSFTPAVHGGVPFDAGAYVASWARFLRSTIHFNEDATVD
ncbi:DUF3000 family protein [Bifidobacterium sp. MA2]|uniref:DUF3000 family protein n=1 Tax=Bifidobacterium santillanense TaxID=2809028 RepID=A0ABS5UMG3_9BIFI|nr:DUF3000 family protein [Bifidobacterium santillanense]MBT1172088.1 DUF3000 family protein [Bifidobacterium santillanense]